MARKISKRGKLVDFFFLAFLLSCARCIAKSKQKKGKHVRDHAYRFYRRQYLRSFSNIKNANQNNGLASINLAAISIAANASVTYGIP